MARISTLKFGEDLGCRCAVSRGDRAMETDQRRVAHGDLDKHRMTVTAGICKLWEDCGWEFLLVACT